MLLGKEAVGFFMKPSGHKDSFQPSAISRQLLASFTESWPLIADRCFS
jgi:hypothetical protein